MSINISKYLKDTYDSQVMPQNFHHFQRERFMIKLLNEALESKIIKTIL